MYNCLAIRHDFNRLTEGQPLKERKLLLHVCARHQNHPKRLCQKRQTFFVFSPRGIPRHQHLLMCEKRAQAFVQLPPWWKMTACGRPTRSCVQGSEQRGRNPSAAALIRAGVSVGSFDSLSSSMSQVGEWEWWKQDKTKNQRMRHIKDWGKGLHLTPTLWNSRRDQGQGNNMDLAWDFDRSRGEIFARSRALVSGAK